MDPKREKRGSRSRTVERALCFNIFGGRSPETCAWFKRKLRLCGNNLSEDDASLSPAARTLGTFTSQRVSIAIAKANSAQIRRGIRTLRSDSLPTRRRHTQTNTPTVPTTRHCPRSTTPNAPAIASASAHAAALDAYSLSRPRALNSTLTAATTPIIQPAAPASQPSSSDDDSDISEEGEWRVESIVSERMLDGELEYEVKWLGFPDATWEPAANLLDTEALDTWEFSTAFSRPAPTPSPFSPTQSLPLPDMDSLRRSWSHLLAESSRVPGAMDVGRDTAFGNTACAVPRGLSRPLLHAAHDKAVEKNLAHILLPGQELKRRLIRSELKGALLGCPGACIKRGLACHSQNLVWLANCSECELAQFITGTAAETVCVEARTQTKIVGHLVLDSWMHAI